MRPVILVGRRDDGGHRDRLWAYVRDYWERELGWPIGEGIYDLPGPFCLAAASNLAATAAPPDWDVALYTSADAVPGDPAQATGAVELAVERGQFVLAHDHYYSISEEATSLILAGSLEPHGSLAEWPAWPNTFSTMFAVPRSLWEAVGGFDERFAGYGFEDFAFWSACWAFGGGFDRVTGPIFHLWHERPSGERELHPGFETNRLLCERYMEVRTSREHVLAILREPGGPLAGNHPPTAISC